MINYFHSQIEQLSKSKEFLKSKIDEYELKESGMISQIKKYTDLVKHLELEKEKSDTERDQYKIDRQNAEKKLEEIMHDLNQKMLKEKELVLSTMESECQNLQKQNQELEERLFKQESLIDRLTRDKLTLTSECESYKKKCNSIDFDTHQVRKINEFKIKL